MHTWPGCLLKRCHWEGMGAAKYHSCPLCFGSVAIWLLLFVLLSGTSLKGCPLQGGASTVDGTQIAKYVGALHQPWLRQVFTLLPQPKFIWKVGAEVVPSSQIVWKCSFHSPAPGHLIGKQGTVGAVYNGTNATPEGISLVVGVFPKDSSPRKAQTRWNSLQDRWL